MRSAFALLGPTASGKSALAMKLAAEFPIEIVSVDSAQVYRGMDVGTAKPSATDRRTVPHHLIDIVDPTQPYSAGRFRADAIRIAREILGRNRIPLLVGGTMLYYRSLASGLDALPAADPVIRAALDGEAKRSGWPALHAELAKVDPEAATRIKPMDAQRIQRALEVWRATGRTLTSLQTASATELPFKLEAFALVPVDRAELHRRIAARFDAMLEDGLVEELRALRQRYPLEATVSSMRAVGYRQAWEFLEGAISQSGLREKGIAATRQLAKRQLTWLRSLPGLAPADRLARALSSATGRPAS
ncbi:MAG: tRNA (adenosine(37)-N6)-dimethylallyltransferase MiaA [Betaproteobacteria bacterium]